MSKTIKLSEETYNELDDLREKRETFDEAVRRLLKVHRTVRGISDAVGAHHNTRGPRSGSEEG